MRTIAPHTWESRSGFTRALCLGITLLSGSLLFGCDEGGTGGVAAATTQEDPSSTCGNETTLASEDTSETCTDHPGFWLDGRHLRDRCCEKVVLRGVSEMVVWSAAQDGTPYFAEIAKTGANVVRIVWETKGEVSKLDAAIANAIASQLIPMPELHDATGDLSKLPTCIDYWVRNDVVAVLQKYQDRLLVNLANEAGNAGVSRSSFTSSYGAAITRMRDAGIHVPLVIDAPGWGQDIDMLQSTGSALISSDPDHNLLFSVHMWWTDPNGARVATELDQSARCNLPLIVGEFAQHGVSGCSGSPFDYKTLLSQAKTLDVGWLAWSWGGVKNSDCSSQGPFDMTTDGTYDGLAGWGLEVARTDPNSIQNTALRPRYMTTSTCDR